jgi:hypothetical protein
LQQESPAAATHLEQHAAAVEHVGQRRDRRQHLARHHQVDAGQGLRDHLGEGGASTLERHARAGAQAFGGGAVVVGRELRAQLHAAAEVAWMAPVGQHRVDVRRQWQRVAVGFEQGQAVGSGAPGAHVRRVQAELRGQGIAAQARAARERLEQAELQAQVDQVHRVEAASPGEDASAQFIGRCGRCRGGGGFMVHRRHS